MVDEQAETVLVLQTPENGDNTTSWLKDMVHFLRTSECPLGLDKAKRRYYRLQSVPYVLIEDVLFQNDRNGMLLRCIDENQVEKVLSEFHDDLTEGHFSARTTAWKVMWAGYYWPTLFKDSHAWTRKCVKCAMFAGKERLPTNPLHPVQVEQPFMRWGVDFIGAIHPPSSAGHKWILTATDYFTRWTEAIALKEANETVVLSFYEEIVTRFGIPDSFVSDNALAFVGLKVTDWALKNGIYLSTSSNYYPQGNGLVESSNKNLIRIIKRTLQDSQRDWHSKLKTALWIDRITPKQAIGNSPYVLVYGKEARLPISTELPTLDMASQLMLFEEGEPMAVRYSQLMELADTRSKSM